MSRKTKAEREAEAKLEAKRAQERERWHQRKLDREYIARKQERKAQWQKKNAAKNVQYVQAFYERYGISGREARAKGKAGAAERVDGLSVEPGKTEKPARPSPQRDTQTAKISAVDQPQKRPRRDKPKGAK